MKTFNLIFLVSVKNDKGYYPWIVHTFTFKSKYITTKNTFLECNS